MKRTVVQMRSFSRILDELIRRNKISQKYFEKFEGQLVENPKIGDVIKGCGGIRKTRLGGIGKGKSGGYRVIYFDYLLYTQRSLNYGLIGNNFGLIHFIGQFLSVRRPHQLKHRGTETQRMLQDNSLCLCASVFQLV